MTDWERAKSYYIKRHFAGNTKMADIAEKAFNGESFYQDMLAEWFDKRNMPDEAQTWHRKADNNREAMGLEIDT